MKILVSGGGTGGHITPILAVAHELKNLDPDTNIVYVGERGSKFADLTNQQTAIDEVYTIYAGKLRRYHNEKWLKRLIDIKTIYLNVRDFFNVIWGTFQSYRLLGRVRPEVIFLKGGYVGLPVGLAAMWRGIPFVTHDSDAVPGLANRIISRWAALHTTGLPTEYYNYPKEKSRYVGVLVSKNFTPVNSSLQQQYRAELDIPPDSKMLLITGGSLGAQRLNKAVVKLVPHLLSKYPDLYIVHQVGKGNQAVYSNPVKDSRLIVLDFMSGMHRYTGAADVVVTRAGANTLAELGVQGKACIVVPNPQLTGGHQLENAKYMLEHHAVLAVDETSFAEQISDLQAAVERLLDYPEIRTKLGQALQSITKPDAAHELGIILLKTTKSL